MQWRENRQWIEFRRLSVVYNVQNIAQIVTDELIRVDDVQKYNMHLTCDILIEMNDIFWKNPFSRVQKVQWIT